MFQVRFLLQGIAALFFIMPMAISHQKSRLRSLLGGRQLAWVGLVSYGVYLWHQTILRQLAKWFTFEPNLFGFLLLLAIVMPSAILFGWVSFRLIEKPALSLAK
jgi:peptidoglycan/LPS O-acetylase OafA/YrhL